MSVVTAQANEAKTFKYRQLGECVIHVDVYSPVSEDIPPEPSQPVPAVVFFHGGGLSVGNRTSWFPEWLKKRVVGAGMAFISADYRLLPPSTGHDIVDDIQALFTFISTELNTLLLQEDFLPNFQVDSNSLAVAGVSAGGLCAYLAAMHVEPKPKAILALYAMGGNFLIPHYFVPKTKVFFRGREMLDENAFQEYLYPKSSLLDATADSKLAYHGSDYHIPGYPSNPRMLLPRLYLQLGTWLDYYTGHHEPSLSAQLRDISEPDVDLASLIAPDDRLLFPHLNVNASWPPTYLVHGADDSAVPVSESQHMHRLLEDAGAAVTLKVVPEQEHSFDLVPQAEELFGGPNGMFEDVVRFLVATLRAEAV